MRDKGSNPANKDRDKARHEGAQVRDPNSPMAVWIRKVRGQQDMDQIEFARYIGKSRSTVAMYETGSPIPIETVALIRSTFMDAPEPPQVGEHVKVVGVAVGEDVYATIRYAGLVPCSEEWGDPLSSEERRPIDPKFAGPNRFLCKVVGDSCYPALQQGDLTVWEHEAHPPFGSIVIAERVDDHGCTVKELHYDPAFKRPRLVPINELYESPKDGDGWTITAYLVGVIRNSTGPERTWYWPPGLRRHHLVDE